MLTGHAILWAILRLAAVLVVTGAVFAALIVLGMALALLRPPRMTGGRAYFFLRRLLPTDLDLPYELINFTVHDHRTGRPLRMASWWMTHPEPSDKCAVILHGYGDSKIGAIAWAPLLQSLGYNVLAVDLRAHGQSQGSFTTAGFHERYDLTDLIDQLKLQRPEQTGHLVLFGVSLGAAVAAATALLRNDLAAVVLECPYADFPSAVLSQARNLPIPGRVFQKAAIGLCQRIAHADFRQVRPVELIPRIPCPLWVVQVDDDPFVPPDDRVSIADAVGRRSGVGGIWRAEGSFHVLALADHYDEYRRRLAEFLDRAISSQTVNRP